MHVFPKLDLQEILLQSMFFTPCYDFQMDLNIFRTSGFTLKHIKPLSFQWFQFISSLGIHITAYKNYDFSKIPAYSELQDLQMKRLEGHSKNNIINTQ